jgi:Predicted metal-dependent hydrolase
MIKVLKQVQDSELGDIFFRKNSRAKQYIIRCQKGKINVTIPWLGSLKDAERFFEKNREKLLPIVEKMRKQTANANPPISSEEIISLKEKATTYLPIELARLAQDYGFQYKSSQVGKSRTQWGSCSSVGTIRLSLYLMLLPKSLIQYVLLHELCHTVHHNHGKNFWTLLDKCTEGKAKQLQKELKKYPIPH